VWQGVIAGQTYTAHYERVNVFERKNGAEHVWLIEEMV
jgi:hypothetical protein